MPLPQKPAVHFSSDEEQPAAASSSTKKTLAQKEKRKSPARQVRTRQSIAPSSSKEQSKHEEEPATPSVVKTSERSQVVQQSYTTGGGLTTKTYELRSLSRRPAASKLMQLSSDEETAIAGSRDTTKSPVKPRMSLRENKFRKQLTDIRQHTGSPKTLPKLQPVSMHVTTCTHVKTRLQFEPTDINVKPQRKALPKFTAKPTTSQEAIVHPPIQVPQQEPCKLATTSEEEEEERRRVPNWLQIGCAEVGFAVFVTLVASLGYFCWASEYC